MSEPPVILSKHTITLFLQFSLSLSYGLMILYPQDGLAFPPTLFSSLLHGSPLYSHLFTNLLYPISILLLHSKW